MGARRIKVVDFLIAAAVRALHSVVCRPSQALNGPRRETGKRQIASVYVWVQVTSDERYSAPPVEAPSQQRSTWKELQTTVWHWCAAAARPSRRQPKNQA